MRGRVVAGVAVAALAVTLAACGSSGSSKGGSGGSNSSATIVDGTTDKVVSFDPAGSFDQGSYLVEYNIYQNLLTFPPKQAKPTPDAAESCKYDDPKTFTCTLKSGLKFSNGNPLTSEDVKFSFTRQQAIKDPNGPSSMLSNLKSIDTPSPTTVTFHLGAPDATFQFIIATGAGFIVDHATFPPKAKLDSAKAVGSGPYKLTAYSPGQQAVLEPNPNYTGDNKPKNGRVIVRYYTSPSALKLAVGQGEVDVAYRSLAPTDVESLKGNANLNVVTGAGAEIRYMVFNLKTMPGANDAQKLAIRKAVAYAVDRQAIATNVYKNTVDPLYTMVPTTFGGSAPGFRTAYGDSPSKDKAEQVLKDAGVSTPLKLTLWYTPSHYGALSADEYTEIKRTLEATGLFSITLKSTEWEQYSTAAFTDQYPIYQLGWFPDYPDADDYLFNFYSKTSFLNNHYVSDKVEADLATEKEKTDDASRNAAFEDIQKVAADDVPIIPIWQGKQLAVASKKVSGVEDTLDASYIFRFWLVSKS